MSDIIGMTTCPFCGSGRVSMSEGRAYGSAPLFRVKCECGAKGASAPNMAEAAQRWNQRAPTAQRAALVLAIQQSYRRLEFGANPIRIEQETDGLIRQLAGYVA